MPAPAVVEWARTLLIQRLAAEKDDDVAATMMESLGVLRHTREEARAEVEALLTGLANGSSARVLGAAKGLEALIRLNPKRPIADVTRDKLRELARIGPRLLPVPARSGEGSAPAPGDADNYARTRRLALMALQAARDDDADTLLAAAQDGDWQVRRLAALRLDLSQPGFQSAAAQLQRDPAFQVRYELLGPLSRDAARTGDCSAVVALMDDAAPAVAMRAIDVVPAKCSGHDAIVQWLETRAAELSHPGLQAWHVPARAMTALARLAPERVHAHAANAARHGAWQVRAAAASVATGDVFDALAKGAHPNVLVAAIDAMRRRGSGALLDGAIRGVGHHDFQLVRAAAMAMPVPADPAERDRAVTALVGALRSLTAAGHDTSRDPRVAIVQKLGAMLPADRAAVLDPYRSDVDPRVAAAATAAMTRLSGRTPSTVAPPRRRYPLQPTPAELAALPTSARIQMADGTTMELELLVADAPVTVARFARLARAGYYNGLTFHRVVPNFVIQGGSPGANEYVGVARYLRDEIGAPHVRGAVGISTRGRDSGDAQIFVDLVDLPRLDHEYTVFARVVSGLTAADRALEGAVIGTVTVR
jgi:cyclophilin family peptidyl-prolyl cis-trans isomerase